MSNGPNRGARKAGRSSSPPFVGALLRMGWEQARARIKDAVRAGGFDDIQDAHHVILRYPLSDGVRLSALARQRGMSRQAANYLVAQLEALGYLERRPGADGGRRLVYLTKRGRQVAATIHASMRVLEDEWAAKVGRRRFADFMDVLRAVAAEDPHAADGDRPTAQAAPPARRRPSSRPRARRAG